MQKKKRFYSIFLGLALFLSGCTGTSSSVITAQYPQLNVLSMDGGKYFGLREFAGEYGASVEQDNVTGIVTIVNAKQIIKLLPQSRKALIGSVLYKLDRTTIEKNNEIYVPISLLANLKKDLKREKKAIAYEEKEKAYVSKVSAINRIVIDAGHGGKDTGARGYGGLKEKDVVLDIAKRVEKGLKNNGLSKVVLTRRGDYFVSLKRRTDIANAEKADLFVSIHANAARARQANGFEVFYLSPAKDEVASAIEAAENEVILFEESDYSEKPDYLNTTLWDMMLVENKEESRELAEYMSKIIPGKMNLKNRGVKSANFYVLRGTRMPAVLIEVGFISNKTEERKLSSSSYRQKMANAIVESILVYDKEFARTNGFTENVR